MNSKWKKVRRCFCFFATIALAIATTGCSGEFTPSNGVTIVSSTSKAPATTQTTTRPQPTTARRQLTPAYTSPAYIPPTPTATAKWPTQSVLLRPTGTALGDVIQADNDGGPRAFVCSNGGASQSTSGAGGWLGNTHFVLRPNGPAYNVVLSFEGENPDTRGFSSVSAILTTYNADTGLPGNDYVTVIDTDDFNTSNQMAIDSRSFNEDGFSNPQVQEVRICRR